MKCNQCINLISAILEGDTSSDESKEFFKHIEECKTCHEEYVYQKQAKEDLKEALDIEGFQFYDSTDEILNKIDKTKYKNSKNKSSRKTFMFLIKTTVPCMLIILMAIFLPPMIKDYYNKNAHIVTTNDNKKNVNTKVDDKIEEIISSTAEVRIDNFRDIIFFNKQAPSKEVVSDMNVITMVNTMLQNKNIKSYNKDLTNVSFNDKYKNQDGLMAVIYLDKIQTTKFKIDSKEVNIRYDIISIPIIDDTTSQTIFFSIGDVSNINSTDKVVNIDSLTTKDKSTFDELLAYCTTNYSKKTPDYKPYGINTNSKCFANLIEKVTSTENGKMIVNSSMTYLLNLSVPTETCALKYFEVLSKNSGIDLLKETINDKMLMQMTVITDKKHGQYNLYAICYNDKIKYCFIEQKGKYFSISWSTLEQITGKTYNQWLKNNNFNSNTIITEMINDHVMAEYAVYGN